MAYLGNLEMDAGGSFSELWITTWLYEGIHVFEFRDTES